MLLKIGKDGYNNNILLTYIYTLYINATGKDKKKEKTQSSALLTLTSEDVHVGKTFNPRYY